MSDKEDENEEPQTERRRHRRTENQCSQTRRIFAELIHPDTTPQTLLANEQCAGEFAMDRVRHTLEQKHKRYKKKRNEP